MSRIGKNPIEVPKGVEVKINGNNVSIKGPKGSLNRVIHDSMKLEQSGSVLKVVPVIDTLENRRFHGLTRTLVSNMVIGVAEGFTKNLTLVGVGYRAQPKGKGVTFSLGYSHPIEFDPPEGVELKVDKLVNVMVTGPDKQMVGQVAAKIRGFRPPEPYHGKGVRYADEVIQTKVGKAAGKK